MSIHPRGDAKRCTRRETIAYALYPVGQNASSMMAMNFLALFLTDSMGLPVAAVAALLALVRSWDAVNDILFGGILDLIRIPGGKFTPWLRLGAFALPVSLTLLFVNPGLGTAGNLMWAAFSYLLFEAAGTLAGVPHGALVTVMTDRPGERTSLISAGILTGLLASVATAAAGGSLVEREGFTRTAALFSVVALIAMLPGALTFRERSGERASPAVSALSLIKGTVKNGPLLAFCASYTLIVASSLVLTLGSYFVKWNLGDLDLMAPVLASSFAPIAAIPALLPALVRLFGKRRLFLGGLALGIALSVVQFFAGYGSLPLFLAINAVKVLGIYLPVTMATLFLADCAEYGKTVSGTRNEGMNFALGSFTSKIGGALSAGISMTLLGIWGYNGTAPVQAASVLKGIWLSLTLLPVVGMTAAWFIFFRFYRLDEARVRDILQSNLDINDDAVTAAP